jgi:hypothetical protein
MIDSKWTFYDKVALRAFPSLSHSTRSSQLNTAALVADILEGNGKFVCSDALAERVRLTADDVKAEEAREP